MYRPDRVILRKIQEFDRHLFVLWNNEKQWFEIWRHGVLGRKRVLSVTRALYEEGAPKEFTPLDERVLGCLYEPWGSGNHLRWFDQQEERELARYREKQAQFRANARHMAFDAYHTYRNFFSTRHASKNTGRPNFNKVSPYGEWVRPDMRNVMSPRLFSRSAANARRYGWKG